MNGNNNGNDSFELMNQKELTEHLEDVNREYLQKINSLESSLERIVRQNEGYNTEITELQEHNTYLYETSNEWHNKYEDTKTLLLNANEEIINLKIILTNWQSFHNDKVNNSATENYNQQPPNKERVATDFTKTSKQYIEENKQLKQENRKYLNQIEQIHYKFLQTTTNHDELNNIKVDLQNELTSSKSRINELDNINNEYLLEIKRLQNENVDLKKNIINLSESRNNSDDLSNSDAHAIQVLYTPELTTKRRCTRSVSPELAREVSSYNSLIVDKMYNDKIDLLINKNEELISIESELANERKQNDELKQQLTKLINDYNFMENEQNIKIKESEQELSDMKQENMNNIQKCNKQIEILTNENKQLIEEKSKNEQLTEISIELEKLRKENEQLLNDKNELEQERKENDELLNKQKDKFIGLTETLKTKIKQLNEYKLNKLKQIKQLDLMQIELAKQSNKTEKDKAEYDKQIQQIERKINEINQQNTQREKILKKQNQQLTAEKNKFESIKNELEKEKKQNGDDISKYEDSIKLLTENAKFIQNQLEKEKKEINDKLQDHKIKNNELTDKLTNYGSKYKITTKQLDEKIELLTKQNDELIQNYKSVKNLLDNEKKRFDELLNKYNKSETDKKMLDKQRKQSMTNDDSDEKTQSLSANDLTLKYTYGMNVYYSKEYAEKQGISSDYITKNTNNDGMVKDCFHVIVRKNDKIAFDDFKLLQAPRVPGAKTSLIKVLRSDMINPKVASHGKSLGSIEVEFNDVDDHEQIMTEWIFYGTMFKVYSYPKSDPKKKKELPITYET